MKPFIALMKETLDNRVAKYQDFDTSAEAQNHVDTHVANYPDAFVHATIQEPVFDWVIDMIAKTISFFPVYGLTVIKARQRKRKEELQIAMVKFATYRDSSPKITDAQLATYKSSLNSCLLYTSDAADDLLC